MNKVILADSQAIFRTGAAKVLAMEEDFRIIAQCSDLERLLHAVDTFPSSAVLFAAALRPELADLLGRVQRAGSRAIAIAETTDNPQTYLEHGVRGIVYRSISGPALVDGIRRVLRGEQFVQSTTQSIDSAQEDMVGQRVCDRLTPKEMKIVALIVQGCKNKEIAVRLGTTEQVIKNYLRSIYDKTGVSDRLELALFTIHHRILAEAAAEAGNSIELQDV